MKMLTLHGIQGYCYLESYEEQGLEPARHVIYGCRFHDRIPGGRVPFIQESREVRTR
jgi:hypothetical protein